ncbi:hypothetical protein [Halobellus salinisoli]|uniref:hypothetical protein n=1 Tax=Halobellus salinisoli TaxID=3108500 RepID=UPI00300B4F08
MSKYFVRYKAKTLAACINRDMQQEHGYGWFKLPDYHQGAVVYDRVLPLNDQYFHHGIGMDVIVEADSLEDAADQGGSSLNLLYSLISFCTNTEVSLTEEGMIIEYDEGLESRDYRQILEQEEQKPTVGTVRRINEDFFIDLYERIYSDDFTESDRRKIFRSLDRFASALRQQTATDQFVWLFIAFDALEDLFVEKYSLDAIREHQCEECGAISTSPDHSAGMSHFLHQCDKTSLTYSELRDIRGSLFHGGPLKDAREYVDEMAEICRLALVDVLDVPAETYEEEIQLEINGHMREEKVPVMGQVQNYEPLDLEDFFYQPGAELSDFEVSYEIVGEKLRRKPRRNITVPEELGVEVLSIGERRTGNIGKPDYNKIDYETKEH